MKNKKLLFSSKLFSSVSLALSPLVVLSASLPNKKLREEVNNKVAKELSPQFDTFKKAAEDRIKEGVKEAVSKVTKFLESEIQKLSDISKEPKEYFKKFERRHYLRQLLNFFKTNKDKFEEEYTKLGMPIIFPFILANDKEYETGTIRFNGKNYDNVKIGTHPSRDYSEVITKDRDAISKNKDKEKNTVKNQEFQSMLTKYVTALNEEIIDLAFNEKEIPVFGKDIFLDDKKTSFEDYEAKAPKNYNSWDQYILSKIKPRFLDFDLRQNQEFKTEQESSNSPKPTPPQLPNQNIKPLVPGKPPVGSDKVNPTDISTSVISLEPIVRYEYADLDLNNIKNIFDTSNQEKRESIFFFNNPINTRFKYSVDSISQSGTGIDITVKITDQAKPNLFRRYIIKKEKLSFNKKAAFLLEKQSNIIKNQFIKLYSALMLDEKINYPLLADPELQTALYGIVELTNSIVNGDKFKQVWNRILSSNISKIGNIANESSYSDIVRRTSASLLNELFAALTNSRINNQPFWYALVNAFLIVKNDLDEISKHKDTRNKIIEKFKKYNFNINLLDEMYKNINFEIQRLKTTVSEITKSFNLISWFDKYTNNVKEIRHSLEILRDLLDPKIVDNKSDEYKKILKSYEDAIKKTRQARLSQNKIKRILGILLLSIGLILLITTLSLFITKFKKLNSSKTIFIITLLIAIIITLIGSILLLLGLI